MAPKTLPPLAVGAKEAARLLGLSERTLAALVQRGEINSSQATKGGKRLFRVAALEAWLISNECSAAPTCPTSIGGLA